MIHGLTHRIPNNEYYDPILMFFWGEETIEIRDADENSCQDGQENSIEPE